MLHEVEHMKQNGARRWGMRGVHFLVAVRAKKSFLNLWCVRKQILVSEDSTLRLNLGDDGVCNGSLAKPVNQGEGNSRSKDLTW